MAGSPDRLSHMSAPCKPVQIISLSSTIYPHLLVKPPKFFYFSCRVWRFHLHIIISSLTATLLFDTIENRLRSFRYRKERSGHSKDDPPHLVPIPNCSENISACQGHSCIPPAGQSHPHHTLPRKMEAISMMINTMKLPSFHFRHHHRCADMLRSISNERHTNFIINI